MFLIILFLALVTKNDKFFFKKYFLETQIDRVEMGCWIRNLTKGARYVCSLFPIWAHFIVIIQVMKLTIGTTLEKNNVKQLRKVRLNVEYLNRKPIKCWVTNVRSSLFSFPSKFRGRNGICCGICVDDLQLKTLHLVDSEVYESLIRKKTYSKRDYNLA